MQRSVIELRQFMELKDGEHYYKGYIIPAMPGWLRVMISKVRMDGLIEAKNFRVFCDELGNVMWSKQGLSRVQTFLDFERDLRDFKNMVEQAGLLMFIEEFREDEKG